MGEAITQQQCMGMQFVYYLEGNRGALEAFLVCITKLGVLLSFLHTGLFTY